MTDWTKLDAELERRTPTLWWRDDDAVADTPALHRLMDLADSVDAPLTLAVIPGNLEDSLAPAVAGRNVTTAVHGWSHTNHAPPDGKKAEFRDHRPQPTLMDEAKKGKEVLGAAFGPQALPLFIPPWNRMDEGLPLAAHGYRGVSIFGQREISHTHNLIRFDSHLDPIDWRGTRSAISTQLMADQIADLLAIDAPIGLMTHHLVHDEAIWSLCEELVSRLAGAGTQWISARDLLTRAAA